MRFGDGCEVLATLPYDVELIVDRMDRSPWFRYRGSLTRFRPHDLNRNPLMAERLRDAIQEYMDSVDDDSTDKMLPWWIDPGTVAANAKISLELVPRERRY